MTRLSVVATLGAAAWVVPEILTASPSGGATLSVPEGLIGPSAAAGGVVPSASAAVDGPPAVAAASDKVTSSGAQTSSGSLAYSGVNLQRDAEIGAALIAGGWAMEHWASRTPDRRPTE